MRFFFAGSIKQFIRPTISQQHQYQQYDSYFIVIRTDKQIKSCALLYQQYSPILVPLQIQLLLIIEQGIMLRLAIRMPFFHFATHGAVGTSLYSRQELANMILQYPYCQIPNKIHRAIIDESLDSGFHESTITQEQNKKLINDAVAISSLECPGIPLLKRYHETIYEGQQVPEQQVKQGSHKLGVIIFQKYYTERLKQLSITNDKMSNEKYLKILCYLCELNKKKEILPYYKKLYDSLMKKDPSKFNLQCKAYMIRMEHNFVKKNLSPEKIYLQNLETFTELFLGFQSSPQKFKTSLILLNTLESANIFPRILIADCMKQIYINVENLEHWEAYEIATSLFDLDLNITKATIEKMTENIVAISKMENGYIKVPLVMKIMNLRHKKRLDNSHLNELIRDHPFKFSSIFFRRNTNKEVFLSVLLNKKYNTLPDQLKIHFNRYLSERFVELSKTESQIEMKEMVRLFKLSLKYFDHLYHHVQKQFAETISNRILEAYEQYPEVTFWAMIYLYKMDETLYPKDSFIKDQTLKILHQFDKKYKSSDSLEEKNQCLSRIIDLNYQLIRKDQESREAVKKLTQYSYNQKVLEDEQKITYLYYLLLKTDNNNLSEASKLKIFLQTRLQVEKALTTKTRFYSSVKNLLTIANVIYKMALISKKQSLNEEQWKKTVHIWYKLSAALVEIHQKDKEKIKQSDWVLIQKYIRPFKNDLKIFGSLIDQTINHPQNYAFNLEEYTSKMKRSKRRNQ